MVKLNDHMNTSRIIILYVLQILTFIAGILLKIMHWPGATFPFKLSFIFVAIYALLFIISITRSSVASATTRTVWIIGYVILVILNVPLLSITGIADLFRPSLSFFMSLLVVDLAAGLVCLLPGVQVFYPKRSKHDSIKFDSF
jgi:hypothetical protein